MGKKIAFFGFSISFSILIVIMFCDKLIENTSRGYFYLPKTCKVGLVLGASKYTTNNSINIFYKYRIEKAIELFKSGKIDFLIVSGDNSRKEYNEPAQMKRDLIKAGVPKNIIHCDYAGFSTYDSILRMKTVFQQTKFAIISQKFHIERAIYIARRNGIKAYGCPSKDPNDNYYLTNKFREYLARVKAVLEVVLDKRPMFIGDKILIN